MKILAVNTSTNFGGVAVTDQQTVLGEYVLNTRQTYSARLLPSIDTILKDLKLCIEDIDAYAIAIGPGSFTGLRIGVSTVKTLALLNKKPMVGINTLEAMAYQITPYANVDICPMLDARKAEVYTALFRFKQHRLKSVIKNMAVKPNDFLRSIDKTTVFFGNGAELYKDLIKKNLQDKAIFLLCRKDFTSAVPVALLGCEKLKKKGTDDIQTLKINYLRKSEAEIHWEKRKK